jgi:hypothetical protein
MSEIASLLIGAIVATAYITAWPLPLTHVQCAKKAKARLRRMPIHAQGHCVYILFDGERVVYVGMTADFTRRLTQHKGKVFTHCRVIRCKSHEQTAVLEKHLIKLFTASGEAKYNRNHAKV